MKHQTRLRFPVYAIEGFGEIYKDYSCRAAERFQSYVPLEFCVGLGFEEGWIFLCENHSDLDAGEGFCKDTSC